MKPKGKILIIGGAEDIGLDDRKKNINTEFGRLELLKEILLASKNKKIEIITTGSKVQEQVKKRYKKAFHKLDYPNPSFLAICDKVEAHDPKYLSRVEQADAIFFTGGDQFRLSTILGGTPLVDIIKDRYFHDKNFFVAGTSAGAMVMSAIMIAEGGIDEALYPEDLKISSGLGLIQDCIIDTHFIKRGRFGRLAHAITLNPDQMGIGLGEDAALLITKGSEAECRGSGMVVIIDGKHIAQTNISSLKDNFPIFVENLRVHILVRGCRFSITKRKLFNPAIAHNKKANSV